MSERPTKSSQITAERLVELNSTCSNTTVPTPKACQRTLETRRQEVSSVVRLSLQQPQVYKPLCDGRAGAQSEPTMGERETIILASVTGSPHI